MSNYTILLIDYEPKSIDRIRRPLTGVGYKVEVATDGISGMEAFHRLKPDLVMIEAMIPKKHGFEVCQELKKTPHGKHTPVIITTSVYKGRKYRNQAFHLHGCDEYIEKPIDEQHVVDVCRRLLGDQGTREIPPEAMTPASLDDDLSEPEISLPLEAFGEMPPAPPASDMDNDEMEIMARLDAILPGGGGSQKKAPAHAPAPAPVPAAVKPAPATPPPPAPAASRPDPFATSFLQGGQAPTLTAAARAEESHDRHEPMTLDEGTSAVPLAPMSDEIQDEEEDASQVVSFEPERSRKKQRRNKQKTTTTFSSSSSQSSATAVAAPVLDEVSPMANLREPAARVESVAVAQQSALPSHREEVSPKISDPLKEPSFQTLDERRPWWLSAAIALVLVGAAGALIYLYLGGLFSSAPH